MEANHTEASQLVEGGPTRRARLRRAAALQVIVREIWRATAPGV